MHGLHRGHSSAFAGMRNAAQPVQAWMPRLAAIIAAFQAIVLLRWYWPGALPDTNTSGVWIALADDFAHGTFYRPLVGELGTGGTRYMPLFFVLHGTLIKCGLAPLTSGILLTLLSVGALLVAVVGVLRHLAVSASLAWATALLLLGTVSFQLMLITVRGDFLAAALSLAGVIWVLKKEKPLRYGVIGIAAGCFAAACLTKLTTLFGLAAMTGWLAAQHRWKDAGLLSGVSLLLIVAGIAVANSFSDGRMLENFSAVADGGFTVEQAAQGPVRFATECAHDPLSIVLFVTAAVSAFTSCVGSARGTAARWLGGCTLLATLVIFLSPGTAANHLIDLQAAAVILIGLGISANDGAARIAGLGVVAFAIGMTATWLPGVPSIARFFDRHHRPEISAVNDFYQQHGAEAHPILAENPLIPILAGERPVVMDWFNLRLLLKREPAAGRAILGRLRSGEFGSVVLSNWPGVFPKNVESPVEPSLSEAWVRLRQRDDLPHELVALLEQRYEIARVSRPYIYLLRKPDTGRTAR